LLENIKLGLILLIFSAIAGLFLGGSYEITKEPIARQAIVEKNEAMKEILPNTDNFEKMDVKITEGSIIKEVDKGLKGSEITGYAIKVAPKGFGGLIDMMVGISGDGKIVGIKILSHSETPGLGANAPNPKFSGQFKNKASTPALEVVKSAASKNNQIEAITGATITSKAVTNGVNEAAKFYTSQLKGGQK
jgi:Na+-translocating ferredoxin:NAD+ oxidoreductase subunit G